LYIIDINILEIMEKSELGKLRKEYGILELDVESVDSNPINQFEKWFKEAYHKEGEEANTMTLSTIGFDGCPEGRVVLLKFYAEDGFTFYTNYESAKGKQLEANPLAALTFHWKSLERQVRIKGTVEKVPNEISDDYFESRPRESRIGAWSSPQSETIPDREFLDKIVTEVSDKYKGDTSIPRPDFWGGYLLKAHTIEFWQGRPSRLHDRLVYEMVEDKWQIKRLAP
jgi:pyridoxamine 5'-phosphate oxidase